MASIYAGYGNISEKPRGLASMDAEVAASERSEERFPLSVIREHTRPHWEDNLAETYGTLSSSP